MTETVETAVKAETQTLEQRVSVLEAQAKTWYEKHLPLLAGLAGVALGGVLGHLVRHL